MTLASAIHACRANIADLTTTGPKTDNWSGVSIKRPDWTMVGTSRLDKGGQWVEYVEKLFSGGKLQTTILTNTKRYQRRRRAAMRREGAAEALEILSYASANRRSRRVTYPTVCSKRVTLLGNANGPAVCAGTERDNGMLGGQLFGPGGDYHSRILDRWAANPGRREGAMVDPERRPLILRSSFSCAQPTEDGFSGGTK